jgi:hypothetical protein
VHFPAYFWFNKNKEQEQEQEREQRTKNETETETPLDLFYRNIFQFYRQEVRKKGADMFLCRTAQAHPARKLHAQPA